MIDRINELAKNMGVSISTIEKTVGLSNGIIGKWRKQSPTCDKLQLVSNYLNVSIDYLLTGKENFNVPNITNSTVGAVGNNSSRTVTINNNSVPEDSKSESKEVYIPEQDISNITKEIIKISESLPIRERIKLLSVIYDFEEDYRNSNT